ARVHAAEERGPLLEPPPPFVLLLRERIGGARVLGVRHPGRERAVEIDLVPARPRDAALPASADPARPRPEPTPRPLRRPEAARGGVRQEGPTRRSYGVDRRGGPTPHHAVAAGRSQEWSRGG